jgi:hypothetical protein
MSQNRSGSRQSIVATATPMTPEQEQALKSHLEAIAQILYDESDSEAMKTRLRDRIDCAAANPDACESRIREFYYPNCHTNASRQAQKTEKYLGGDRNHDSASTEASGSILPPIESASAKTAVCA